jgi:sulfatase-like protein
MAVAEKNKPFEDVRAVALLAVFVLAKLAILTGREVPVSGWSVIAYFWQDGLVALIFGLVDRTIQRSSILRSWLGWTLYGACVGYAAVNVPVARVLSSPLTWSMVGATGGALADSIKYHATPVNLALMILVIAFGAVLPAILYSRIRLIKSKHLVGAAVAALAVVMLGPIATSKVETIGLGRNAIVALVTSSVAHILARPPASLGSAEEAADDWRISPRAEETAGEDLTQLRGAARGRNVVMILLESTGAEYLRPYGSNVDPMPYLSDFSRESVLFENAYAVYPESIKGLFSVLCSRYPAMNADAGSFAKAPTPSIATALEGAGYKTALFHSGRFMYLGMDAVVSNRGYDVIEDAGAIGGNRESSFGVDESSTVRGALSWIDSLRPAEHFFLTYLPIAGHHPYDSPEEGPFPEQRESDRYLNALHYADTALAELVEGLRARGALENTLFVIFGDHGEAFEQHQGNYGHSLFLYDENVHVPYLIVAPGLIAKQIRVRRAISLIDTAPTVLDLVGAATPREFRGTTALASRARMALFFTDYSLTLVGFRDGCWKYIYELESGRSKLFDLCGDPRELNDLASTRPELTAAYHARAVSWSDAGRPTLAKHVGAQ